MSVAPTGPPIVLPEDLAYREEDFPALRLARSSRLARRLGRWLLGTLVVTLAAMLFAPWQQSIRGAGSVIAFDPVNRRQSVEAPIKGVISEIGPGVAENARVTKGQLVYRIADQDPQYLARLQEQVANSEDQVTAIESRQARNADALEANHRVTEAKLDEVDSTRAAQTEAIAAADAYVLMAENKLDAERAALVAAEGAVWQAQLDYDRKKRLADQGYESGLKMQEVDLKLRQAKAKREMAEQYVASAENEVDAKRRDRESKRQEWQGKLNKVQSELAKARSDAAKSEGDIAKTQEELAKARSELAKLRTQLARQETQEVRAPRDGFIMRLVAYDKSAIVKQGDPLFDIVPDAGRMAVQVWVSGNDAPLVLPGKHVRLQFEGWPMVQFSGWPSVAVGTFGGTVALVDPTDDGAGRFRVVVTPDPDDDPWPEHPYLRQGARANAWVLLNQVPLGYEVWRRLNGFPPSLKSKDEAEKAKPPKIKV